MSWPKGYWHMFEIDEYMIDQLSSVLEKETEFDSKNLTINGKQTRNVLDKIEVGYIEIPFMQSLSSTDIFRTQPCETKHIHLIHYDTNGYQLPHDHSETEDFSFIVYLNDSDQKTAFYRDGVYMYITPERGKGIVFDSKLLHWSLPGTIEKKVAVGAVDFVDVS
jgi:hypothetical protein